MNWLRVKNNADLRLDPNAEEKYYQGKHRIVGKITKGQQAVQDYKELQGDEQATGFIGSVYNLYGHWSACDLQENI